jgi:hypothetical protein
VKDSLNTGITFVKSSSTFLSAFQMQTRLTLLMIGGPHRVLPYLLDQIWSPGVPENKLPCLDQVLKLNTNL